ncbi:MAG: hypothetical protein ACI9DH_000966 [Halioglobus sp.]
MEKLIYPIWKSQGSSGDELRDAILNEAGPTLLGQENVRALRLSVVDSDVASAAGKRMENCQTLPDGMISVWLDNGGARGRVDGVIAGVVDRFSTYLVVEAEPIVNTAHRTAPGERGHGFCQVVFLQRPDRLTEQEWLSVWQGSHTQIAIDTQSTFCYRQNVIVRSVSAYGPMLHAMIEENFPPGAMTSDHAFYGVSDDENLKKNLDAMVNSCSRFIDFDKIDVIPMSEYVLKYL